MVVALAVICGVEALALIMLILALVKVKSKRIVVEKKGVRYTVSDETRDDEGKAVASFVEGDIVLVPDRVYKVNKQGPIKPGRYNILSTQENFSNVNIKVNGVTRTQAHDSGIVFAEGDIVIAPNVSIILR